MMYQTKDGDRLDAICFTHYGATCRYVEVVLAANPQLANQPPMLPAGLLINLPALPELKPQQTMLRLWD